MENFTESLTKKYDLDPALRLPINTDYTDLIQDQTRIGWTHLAFGRYSTQWTVLQYMYASQFDKAQNALWLHRNLLEHDGIFGIKLNI
eukprot:4723979-Ditylum_brightwellii.AAC.1